MTAPRRRRRAWTKPRELGVTLPDIVIAPELAVLGLLDQAVPTANYRRCVAAAHAGPDGDDDERVF